MAVAHDIWRHNIVQSATTVNAAGGASTQSAAFDSQTRAIRITFPGAITATAGLRFSIGTNPTASSTTQLLPVQWIEYIQVNPGEKIAFISNDTVTGSVVVVELSN